MGLLERLKSRIGRLRVVNPGAALEVQGRLHEAYEWYASKGTAEEAVRVLLACATAETDPSRRLGLLALAASKAPAGSAFLAEARRRKALLSFDLFSQQPSSLLPSEQRELAEELEQLGLGRQAADVLRILGDLENQARVLAASGALVELETALDAEEQARRRQQDTQLGWNMVRDQAALGHRRKALSQCELWLAASPDDEQLASFAKGIRSKLVRSATFAAEVRGEMVTVCLADEVVIGRCDGLISLPSPVLSRRHLRIRHGSRGPTVEDLQSRNGTLLAGAKIAAPIEIGAGLKLMLGGQVACRVEPCSEGGVRVSIADHLYLCPLGALQLGPFRLVAENEGVLLLQGSSPSPPVLNGLIAKMPIDVSEDDEIREHRDGPILMKVASQ